MTRRELIKLMLDKQYILEMGSGKLSKRYKCSREDIYYAKNEVRKILSSSTSKKLPKILILDLEMAPMRAYVWRRWKENITLDQTITDSFILCWSAKWLYSNEIISDALTPKEISCEDDSRITHIMWSLLNEADIVVAYNGKKADLPWLNSAFLRAKLPPCKPFFIVDPYEVVKKVFGFTSNKMDAIAGYLGIEHKLETSFELWKDCMEGSTEAMRYMVEYNQMDVKILEEIYLRMRPWIPRHPNVANIIDEDVCPFCGLPNYEELVGQYYYTTTGKYKLYRCIECGAIFRSRFAEKRDDVINTVICGH